MSEQQGPLPTHERKFALFWVVLLVGLTTLFFASLYAPKEDARQAARPQPGQAYRPEFTSSSTCAACHPGESASWRKTYHRTMTQPASAATIRAPFSAREFSFEDKKYRVFMEKDGTKPARFMADMPRLSTTGAQESERMVREIVMVTGSHHMQAYWISMEQELTDVEKSGQRRFNKSCATCHGENAEGGTGTAGAPMLVGKRLISTELLPSIKKAILGRHAAISDESEKAAPQDELRMGTVDDATAEKELLAYLTKVQFDGRLMQFPYVYLIDDQRWIHEEDSFLQPPRVGDELERPGDRWGFNCDECHSVGPSFGWLGDEARARSSAVELGISCEACHGAGKKHAERHQDPFVRYAASSQYNDDNKEKIEDDIVHPDQLDARRASHLCAQCHADLEREGAGYLPFSPGDDLEKKAKVLAFASEDPETWPDWIKRVVDEDRIENGGEGDRVSGSLWPDGTVRVAGRMYNGMMLSACSTRGTMSCTSCHSMHGATDADDLLKPEASRIYPKEEHDGDVDESPTDMLCVQCHERENNMGTQHTHHLENSTGSLCINCHMPHTTYGLLNAIRSHRVDSPSARVFSSAGRPQACALCHLDKSQGSLAENLNEWYGQPVPELDDDDKRHGEDNSLVGVASGVRMVIEGDAVVRALAAFHLGWQPAVNASRVNKSSVWRLALFAELLDDDYVAVRQVAERSLKKSLAGLVEEGVSLRRGQQEWSMPYPVTEEDRAKNHAFLLEKLRLFQEQAAHPTFPARLSFTDVPGKAGLNRRAVQKLLVRDDKEVRINE
ncbi:MAG: hypothetical protein GY822_20575 [Deltaproteobacteria bacterium]|nr:hypothetical protein [Deltaproteobacteria bacterium]